jgi:hypothetical protein
MGIFPLFPTARFLKEFYLIFLGLKTSSINNMIDYDIFVKLISKTKKVRDKKVFLVNRLTESVLIY